MSIWVLLGVLVCSLSLIATATILARLCTGPVMAVTQLLTPWWALGSIVVGAVAGTSGSYPLALWAVVAVGASSLVIAPKLRHARDHRRGSQGGDRVGTGAVIRVALSNLYLDNEEPDEAIAQLLEIGPDLLVMTELTPELLDRFNAIGGAAHYPHRVHPEPIRGEFEVGIFSREPFVTSGVRTAGELQLVEATRRFGERDLRILAVHPEAPTDRSTFRRWKRQLRQFRAELDDADPLTIALGDLNSGTLQPPYEHLVAGTFRDAHAELGRALKPSWGIATWMPRWVPTFVARLDHLLLGNDVEVLEVEDLDPVGSDHRPFVATLWLDVGVV